MRIFQKKISGVFKKEVWQILAILANPKVYGRFHVDLLNWENVGVSIWQILC